MKQETIDVLRMVYPPHLEDSKFMSFELRTETWADILAVLEAAQRWAEARAQAHWTEIRERDALLALIDLDDLRVLGGTK